MFPHGNILGIVTMVSNQFSTFSGWAESKSTVVAKIQLSLYILNTRAIMHEWTLPLAQSQLFERTLNQQVMHKQQGWTECGFMRHGTAHWNCLNCCIYSVCPNSVRNYDNCELEVTKLFTPTRIWIGRVTRLGYKIRHLVLSNFQSKILADW